MFESTSPFDDAMSKPFLDEPAKKRWSIQTASSGSSNSTPSSSSSSSPPSTTNTKSASSWLPSFATSPSSVVQESPIITIDYQAPDLEDIDIEIGHQDETDGAALLQEVMQCEGDELDFAIMRERHQDITEINSSMYQINEIQKDLALVVDSQGHEIDQFESMAIESLDHTSSGLSQLLGMQARMAKNSKEHKRVYTGAISILLMVCAHWMYAARFDSGDGSPQH